MPRRVKMRVRGDRVVAYHFGNCVVDPAARLVSRNGVPAHLSPKAFDLLVLLIRERPGVLARSDLHARLWPDSYVSDASLAMLVAEARAALGERGRGASAIRTLHRRGYAFQGDVRELAASSDTASPTGFWLVTDDRHIALVTGENIIGRDPQARVFLDAPSVSRRHARIVIDASGVSLEDLGSKNGTRTGAGFVANSTCLTDGEALTFGSVGATLRAWHPDPTKTEGGR